MKRVKHITLTVLKVAFKALVAVFVYSLKVFAVMLDASIEHDKEREAEIDHAASIYGCDKTSLDPFTLTPYDDD